jgi:hypothetical protein
MTSKDIIQSLGGVMQVGRDLNISSPPLAVGSGRDPFVMGVM